MGLIPWTQKEIAIMDTYAFQRLRRIRQLAMARLVYPGAMNSRFDHSIGVMHLAGRIFERLDEFEGVDPTDKGKIRIAALLHNIGQGPFSHVSEFLLEQYSNKGSLSEIKDTGKIRERLTADII